MKGFLISFLFNLIFNTQMLVLAAVAFMLHILFNTPMMLVYIFLGLWIIMALLITLGLGVLTRGTPPTPYQKNKNPYSKTTKDFLKKSENSDT